MAGAVVSSDSELVILVNSADEEIGHMAKLDCHLGDGVLHRAFSVFLFNSDGDVLLQRRHQQKFLWASFWSNACCSHPRRGEGVAEAATRRVREELGIVVPLNYLYKFIYQAKFKDIGSEHELCSVWVGKAEAHQITANTNEISEWRFFTQIELDRKLSEDPGEFTPWMEMEWERLRQDFAEVTSGQT